MPSAVNVNDMRVSDAAKYYASIGIITNPIYAITDRCTSPGKQPIPSGWQIIEKPYSNEAIDVKFKNDKNLGFLCGSRSNLTVVDRDWRRKGIWEGIFSGIDTSTFVKVSHTKEKDHLLFKYCKELRAGQYKALGFDILSDDALVKDGAHYVAGDNCVCAPSMHKDGNRYQISGNIEERPEVPEAVVKRLSELIDEYKYITKNVLPKCRQWFKKMWKALFELKDHELYHQTDIFYGDMENRIRCLHFCAELKANGAEDNHLNIICMLLFGDRYNSATSKNEIRNINDKPATADTIKTDPYFSRFYTEHINDKPNTEKEKARSPEKKEKPKSSENKLSYREREVLKLAFKKMLYADSDGAQEKNGVGFNRDDSKAIHEDMDGETEVSDDILIKHAYRLKRYTRQLTEFGIDTDELEAIIKEFNKNSFSPYLLTDKGVGKFKKVEDPEDPSGYRKVLDIFLHTPVKVTALSDDLDGEKIRYKIGIEHPVNGHIDLWKDQGELLTRSGVNKLLSEGLIGTDSSYKDITGYFMLDILRAANENQKEFIASKTGWKRDNTIFVAGNEAYIIDEVIPVNLTNKNTLKLFTRAGTLEGWVNGSKWVLQHESARINCYTAGAGIIAGLLKQQSAILQNKGITSSGKTLKSSVAVSMFGNPTEIVKSADTSRTYAERDAIATNGMCSVYDEVGLLKNPDGLTYLLSNGRKKNRGTKEGIEENENWFKSFILNGEFEFLKESAAQGEIGRLIECPWKLPNDAIKAKKTEVEIKEHYGHIAPLFFRKLFPKLETIKDRYTFLCSSLPSSDLDIGSRLKDSFALIIIAGEILEDVFEDIGIERKDPYAICEKLYLDNITSERVQPYWKRGLNLIIDEVNACKPEIDGGGEETGKFFYKGQLGGDLFGLYIDIYTGTFRDMCQKHELKNSQLMQDWRDNEITEVDKSKEDEPKKSQKTIKVNGTPKKVIRLIKSKVYETLGMNELTTRPDDNDSNHKYDRETLEIIMLKRDLEKHVKFYIEAHKTASKYILADSFFVKYPGMRKHYKMEDITNLIEELKMIPNN